MTTEEKKSEAKRKEDDDRRKGEDTCKDAERDCKYVYSIFPSCVLCVHVSVCHTGRMSSPTSSTIELDEDELDIDNESSGH